MKHLFKNAVRKNFKKVFLFGLTIVSVHFFVFAPSFAQSKKAKPAAGKTARLNLPKVTRVDSTALVNLLKRDGENSKPLLVNFWATWCDPCREEFPDLVKLDGEYKGKVDFITVSLDDLADINTEVPKFLESVKSSMPAYLLKTEDEDAAIVSVYKDWKGGLPFTILFDGKGAIAYSKQGKIKLDVLRAEINKISTVNNSTEIVSRQIINLPLVDGDRYSYEKGIEDAAKDVAAGKLIIKRYGLTAAIAPEWLKKTKQKYGVEFTEHGCIISNGFVEYARGYNETSTAAIRRKFGGKASEILGKL